MVAFEYMILDVMEKGKSNVTRKAIEVRLNECGRDGWEVIDIEVIDYGSCMQLKAVLKRAYDPESRLL